MQINLNMTWDTEVDAAYIYFGEEGREVGKTIPIFDEGHTLLGSIDLSASGELIGLELLRAASLLPFGPETRR
jgi:uncharacterized protein YuzE